MGVSKNGWFILEDLGYHFHMGVYLEWGLPNSWMVYLMENPNL